MTHILKDQETILLIASKVPWSTDSFPHFFLAFFFSNSTDGWFKILDRKVYALPEFVKYIPTC